MKNSRQHRLLPNGKPRWVRIYDNEGDSADRYTCIFTGRYTHKTEREHLLIGMSERPYHPQGVGIHSSYPYQCDTIGKDGRPWSVWPPAIGRKCHLGKRIVFDDLPFDCKILVMDNYCCLWDLKLPKKYKSL